MPTNVYFSHGTRNEQYLIEDLIIESLKIYGNEFFYIPRTLVSKDNILGEDRLSEFKSSFPIEMYFENVDSMDGQGAFIQKFGLMMEQSATLVVARRRWDQLVGRYGQTIIPTRPCEGDLIYFPLSKGLFEIKFVKHQDPFYQLGKLYVYKLQIELFQYASERIDTGIKEIDAFETLKTFSTNSTRNPTSRVLKVTMTNNGSGYTTVPTVQFISSSGFGATATAVLGSGTPAYATALETYNESRILLEEAFTQKSSLGGYPWGITLPVSQTTHAQILALGPIAITSYTLNNVVPLAKTVSDNYILLQAALSVGNAGKVIAVTVTEDGQDYQTPPVVNFVGGGGVGAQAVSTVDIDIDKVESFGDNNSFKQEATDIVFSESNPFGEVGE